MNEKKVPILVGIFLLVHVTTSSLGFSEETCPLIPPTKVSSINPNVPFRQLYDTVYIALSIYKLDALGRYAKDVLMRRFNAAIFNREVSFDLEHIDVNKKGWTRYYPVYIGEKQFIVRIFLTEEKSYQLPAEVLFGGTVNNPNVTFQVLPALNSILKDVKITPYNSYSSSDVARSP